MSRDGNDYVHEGRKLLFKALRPLVEQRLEATVKGYWQCDVAESLKVDFDGKGNIEWDLSLLLRAILNYWNKVFQQMVRRLDRPIVRSIVHELIGVRNKHSHEDNFSLEDAERALDSMRRLMAAFGLDAEKEQLTLLRNVILQPKFESFGQRQTGGVEHKKHPVPGDRSTNRSHQIEEITFDSTHKIIIIKIKRETVIERGSVYEAVRWSWKINATRARRANYVLAIVDKVCEGIFVPIVWKESERSPGRWEFEGHEADEIISAIYKGKLIPADLRKPGMASPVLYRNL